ncbi:MAG: ATP-dependent metallopeptidase FtsH/Yme1/Tma family protein [Acidimicrobiia bacterium]
MRVVLAAGLFGAAMLLPNALPEDPNAPAKEDLSVVLAAVEQGTHESAKIERAVIDDDARKVTVTLAGDTRISASYPEQFGTELVNRLETSGVPFTTEAPERPSMIGQLALSLLPIALIIAVFVYFSRKNTAASSGGGVNSAKAFTTTNAEVANVPNCRFSDVVGCDEALDELSEVVTFLHDADRFKAAGARMPRGFLLVGPPGTGKTLLARAVAGEAGVPFYSAAGSDFAEMFVGVGAARVRDLFAKAKKTGGIVFIDELDSVGRARHGAAGSGVSEERESTLNALLVEMDGFGKEDNIIVVAATNRPDVLDSALLRAGRFDRQVTVAAPDRRGRTRLLDLYSKDRNIDEAVDFVALARRTPGLTGADISNLVNQAALEAARNHRSVIQPGDFDEALATTMMGRARKSALVSDRDREITAWHEAGHTLAALMLPDAQDPVQVTIVPRGPAGGVTWMAGDDGSFLTRSQARASLVVVMGGRAAEELLLDGDFTQGASSDLANATSMAIRMVTQWGMSDLSLSAIAPEMVGPGQADKVMAEVDRMLADALAAARSLLAQHSALMAVIVAELLAEETVDLDRLRALAAEVAQEQTAA